MHDFSSLKTYQNLKRKSVAKRFLTYLFRGFISSFLCLGVFYKKPEQATCDVLILNVSEKVNWRTELLVKKLTDKGLIVKTDTFTSTCKVLLKRMLCKPEYNVPLTLLFHASFSKYIVESYKPRVLITLVDSSLYSPFLRLEMNSYGKVVNIGHAVTVRDFLTAGMIDFDYYFLFGKKSLENLLANKVRIGNTKAVLTGSIFIDENFHLPPIEYNEKFLFFSAWVKHHYHDVVMRSFQIVTQWAERNPEKILYVKLHPLEDTDYWYAISEKLDNVIVYDQKKSIKESLIDVCSVMVTFSVASVEASLLNRPVIVVKDSDVADDLLDIENFFPSKARTAAELSDRIEEIRLKYDYYVQQCTAFADYHLSRKNDSLIYVSDLIFEIAEFRDISYEMIVTESVPER